MKSQTLSKKSTKTIPKKNEIGLHIGCVADWKTENECEYILQGLEQSARLGFHSYILAKGDDKTVAALFRLQDEYGKLFTVLEDSQENREWVLRHSHVLLIPHNPSKSEIIVAQNNSLVPLTPHNKYLETFNPVKEQGTAFLFAEGDSWDFFRCAVRAAENKQFGYDWSQLKKALGKVKL